MSFVSYEQKEDMQDDTYKIITQLLIRCVQGVNNYDVEFLYTNLNTLYLLVWKRLPKEQSENIQTALNEINNSLHNIEREGGTMEQSVLFDTSCKIFKTITGVLDDQGILYRMRADLDSLVTQGS